MASSSISGLASGLDTATIISQLMQLEAVPQTRLQSRVTTEERQVTSMTTLNSKVASLAAKAKDLLTAAGWQGSTTTSSSPLVTVTAAASATPTATTITVDRTAATHQLGFTDASTLTGVVTTGSTKVRLDRLDGTGIDVDSVDGTLQGLVTALNDPANATGVRATAVKVGTDSYRLLVESTATGASEDFALTNLDGTPLMGGATVRAGRDAQISLGAGIVATSRTNTFTDLMPGISVTVAANAAAGTTSEIAVSRDTNKVVANAKALVDGINNALADISSLTAYNPTTKVAGMLAGDANVRNLRTALLGSIYPTDGTSLAAVGIQVDRSGKLILDETALRTAYAADPAGVVAKFTAGTTTGATDGFAKRVHVIADGASNSTDGTITAAITGRASGIKRLKDNIADWDNRLELRRVALTRQFTALETALSQMNQQGNWLSGQISSLPSSSGS